MNPQLLLLWMTTVSVISASNPLVELFSRTLGEILQVPSSSPKTSANSSTTTTSSPTLPFVLPIPIINLRRRPNDPKDYHKQRVVTTTTVLEELECTHTMFMSPFHHPVTISLNQTVYDRVDTSCTWNFIGTEPCIPSITCAESSMQSPCDDEVLEISDGYRGRLRVCGGGSTLVTNVTAADDLRDLYVRFTAAGKKPATPSDKDIFTCTVVCSQRGQGNQLQPTFEPKTNPKCYCGTKPNEDRIVGGENAKKSEFPWLVALVETNTRQPFCGGSILNDKLILTAGHCIKGRFMDYTNIQVIVNGHSFDSSPNSNVLKEKPSPKTYPLDELEQLDKGNGSLRVNIDEIIVHPLYVSETNDYDVALLRLQTPLDLSQRPVEASEFQPPRSICLPPVGSYLRTYSNNPAVIAGWGLPDVEAEGTPLILQKLNVTVFSPQTCKEMYRHRVNRRMVCAGHREGGRDACSGDSGGPLVVQDRPKVWVQVGSVSWGEGCAIPGQPGVYFRTTEAVQWAHSHSNAHNASWCVVP